MASPLNVFRKHQKTLMIIFGILLMISFLVVGGSNLDDSQNLDETSEVEVVAVWDRGDITDEDLYTWRRDRIYAASFVSSLMQQAREKKRTVKGDAISGDTSEQALIQTVLLARKAKEEQIEVSQDAIRQYLAGVAGEGMTDEELRRQLRAIGDGRFTLERMFTALERELLANNMYIMMNAAEAALAGGTGEYGVPPTAAWDYFNRLHRRAKVELLPIQVADYLDKTKDPSDAQLQEFYDKHKNSFDQPGAPDPGFKIRRKIAFQWLKADANLLQDKLFVDYVKEETGKVTDKEIQEYYDRNKSQFQKKPPSTPPAGAGVTAPGAAAPASDPASGSPEANSETPDSASPAETNSAEENPVEATPPSEGEAAPQDDAPAQEPPAEAPPSGAEPPGVAGRLDERFFVVAQNESPAAEESPAPEESSQPQDAQEPPSPETSPEETPAPAEQPQSQPAADSAETPPADVQPAAGSAAAPGGEKQPAAPAVEYEPLEAVKDKIRESIAREKAQRRAAEDARKQMNDRIDDAKKELNAYSRKYKQFPQRQKRDASAKPPAPPDFAALAKKYGLTSGKTDGPLDPLEIRDTEIGKATRTFINPQVQQILEITFAEVAYTDEGPKYYPQIFSEGIAFGSNRTDVEYLYWKTEDLEPRVPELKEIREEVVREWKMREALKVARQEAEEMAEKARKSKKSLAQTFPKGKAFETAEFSWMTRGATPFSASGAPTFSQVFHADGGGEVEYAGDDFMGAVFRLESGEVGVAVDNPKEMVYVVRLIQDAPAVEIRRQNFLDAGLTGDIVYLARVENAKRYFDWYRKLEEDWGLRWLRTPGASDSQDM